MSFEFQSTEIKDLNAILTHTQHSSWIPTYF